MSTKEESTTWIAWMKNEKEVESYYSISSAEKKTEGNAARKDCKARACEDTHQPSSADVCHTLCPCHEIQPDSILLTSRSALNAKPRDGLFEPFPFLALFSPATTVAVRCCVSGTALEGQDTG
jgi:hypothetical protein